jgi:hypothetical protein
MISHRYQFSTIHPIRIVAGILITITLLSGSLHFASYLGLLPSEKKLQDVDQTIITFQTGASREIQDSKILLMGDSTCLMNVSAVDLTARLNDNPKVQNLGLLSYLDMTTHHQLLSQYLESNETPPHVILLLFHPTSLRRSSSTDYHQRLFEWAMEGNREDLPNNTYEKILYWTGMTPFHDCLLNHLVSAPLKQDYARKYGFTSGILEFMKNHNGSLIHPKQFTPADQPLISEIRMSDGFKRKAIAFNESIPKGTTLLFGLTPSPESLTGDTYVKRIIEVSRELKNTLPEARFLENLPVTLPDTMFADRHHLNQTGMSRFTEILSEYF